jgi:hypothetical protein
MNDRATLISPCASGRAGGNKFDLMKWDEAYFDRLKDFIREAVARRVVVELALLCTMYDDPMWETIPMHARNNVNGIGRVGKNELN